MNLNEIRKNIDRIDSQILKLINQRTEQALMSKKFKTEIKDEEREKEIFEKLVNKPYSLLDKKSITKIYEIILKDSKLMQSKDLKLIGFQGAHGAYSEIAAKAWNDSFISVPCPTFADIFFGVEKDYFDYGIVPIENTLGGVLGDVNRLLINTNLKIIGAVNIDIHHCLMALPEADHREIKDVYSHYQALAQCKKFIERSKLTEVPYYDTAGSAKLISDENKLFSATICSKNCAEIYDLEILKENIEDIPSNKTRFLILSKEDISDDKGEKCSIIFSTQDKAGTLFHVLEIFAQNNINLTRIESIPGKPGDYVFFLDFEGNYKDQKISNILQKLETMTVDFRLMGCYKEIKASS
jgi:prephenate dehydratase/chorismate mutase